jgi:hypothetical protein
MLISLDHRHHQCAGWHHQYWSIQFETKPTPPYSPLMRSTGHRKACNSHNNSSNNKQSGGFFFFLWQFAIFWGEKE